MFIVCCYRTTSAWRWTRCSCTLPSCYSSTSISAPSWAQLTSSQLYDTARYRSEHRGTATNVISDKRHNIATNVIILRQTSNETNVIRRQTSYNHKRHMATNVIWDKFHRWQTSYWSMVICNKRNKQTNVISDKCNKAKNLFATIIISDTTS